MSRLAPLIQGPVLLPFLSGMILVFAFPPFSIPVLPFVGLVPLLWILNRPLSGKHLFLAGMAFSLPYFLGHIYWLFLLARFTAAGTAGAIGTLCMHLGTFFVFAVGLNVLKHTLRVPLPLAAPVLWVVSEHARAYGDFYFPWVTLGYSLSDWPLLIQHADIIGVYGISYWLVLINSLIVGVISGRTGQRVRVACGVILTALLVLPLPYGAMRWEQIESMLARSPTIDVAIIQPNIPQRLKWSRQALNENVRRLNRIIAEAERTAPLLIVGPEASVPMIVDADDGRLPVELAPGSRPLLLGIVRGVGERVPVDPAQPKLTRYRWHWNSAVLAAPDRRILAAHDKQYLVPVTEQIPYKRVLGFTLPFMRNQFGRFVPADDLKVLTLTEPGAQVRFGVLICYESLFPGLVRKLSRMDAEFLVNITNDAWFGRSSMSHQHLGFLVLRAIETRRAVARSANTGISAVVDPLGRVTARTGLFEEAIIRQEVPLSESVTFYMRWGDMLLYLSYLLTAILFGLGWRAHRRGRPVGGSSVSVREQV